MKEGENHGDKCRSSPQSVPVLDVLGRVDLLHDPEAVDLLFTHLPNSVVQLETSRSEREAWVRIFVLIVYISLCVYKYTIYLYIVFLIFNVYSY
jgi:hypothetical protein